MLRYRSLPVIAVRRMLGNWRLLLSVVIGTLVAAAIISSTAIYSDAIRDLGLDFALKQQDASALDVQVSQSTIGIDRNAYQSLRGRVDATVGRALGPASGQHIRQGSTATFFPTPPGALVPADEARPRAFFRFRSELEAHVEVVDGALPDPAPRAEGRALPVAVGAETAERNGMTVGQRFDVHPFWDPEAEPLMLEVAAIIHARDLDDRYWGGDAEALDRRTQTWETFAFFVPEASFFGALPERFPGIQGDLLDIYTVNGAGLNARNGVEVSQGLRDAERVLRTTETRLRLSTNLVTVLETYDEKLFFTQIPLLVLLLQIAGIVAYYLLMVSNMLVERQASEIALLRSRGATTPQLLAQYAVEGLILAGLATAVGPPLAAGVIALLGPTPPFSALSGGGLLEVNVSTNAYVLAAAGALIAFLALMVPAWRVTRSTLVELRRASARPRPTPAFLRYYLDVAFVIVSAIVFWQLSRQDQLFTETLLGDLQVDPFLLLTPAVFMVTVGVVFLRLFPLLLRGIAVLLAATKSTAVLVGIRSLVRNPTHYTRLILLLMFATGVGMFGASFSATLDRSYADRAAYAVGADVRASEMRGLTNDGVASARAAIEAVPSEVASPVVRAATRIETGGGAIASGANLELLGVDPETFDDVAFFREDFAPLGLAEMTSVLAGNGAEVAAIPIPGEPRQIGAWIRAPQIRGEVDVAVRIRDADGRYVDVQLTTIRPTDPVVEEWRFVSASLETLLGGSLPPAPLELTAYYVAPRGAVAGSEGSVLLGAVLVTEEPRPDGGPAGPEDQRTEAFPGATLVHEFASTDGLDVLHGYTPERITDVPVTSGEAPPGFTGSIAYRWISPRRGPPVRGVRPASPVAPMLLYLSRPVVNDLELQVGDTVRVTVNGRYTDGELAGVLDLLPTSPSGSGFGLANIDRLLYVSNSTTGQRTAVPSEAWYRTEDPQAAREVLAGERYAPQTLLDVESERLAQQEDPLVAAGWQGILAIAFGAVLLLSAIGFLVYSYLTAQERGLEFAILRTLGFSRGQIFGVVAFEHLFVIGAGMGLGTLVGLQVGRLMMNLLATDERGAPVLPPFVLGISWPSIFVAWAILGAVFAATIGAVVLLYVRLQVHRALRIGDA